MAHLIECNVYSECGGIVVWSQRGLLIWLISNYKGQVKLSLQTHRQKGVMQAFAQKLATDTQSVYSPLAAPALQRKASAWFPVQHSRPEMEQRSRERSADHLHHHVL